MPLTPGRSVSLPVGDLAATSAQRGMPSRPVSAIGGTGWTPAQLPGLELWLDAADTATITEASGEVSQWDDKSGFGRHVVQATGAAKPGTGVETQNGLNVLTFDGNDWLKTSAATTIAQPWSVFAVAWYRDGADNTATRIVCSLTGSASAQLINAYALNAETALFAGTDFAVAGSSVTRSVWRLHGGIARGAASVAFANGVAGSPTNAGTQSLDLVTIGARGDTLFGLDGRIAEVVVCSGAIITANRIRLERYLNAKWAIY